ncbi:unnamed protein product [Phaedon cochleariae]|uniref:Uncharacterized protein n=1 Tax=Phaedon cochleariae TaxID=80249 RepID=A0A9P0GS66_PHACE|nr:unnamed protein product [Phaedon cochleariae]
MIPLSLFVFVLVQSSIANLEDPYPDASDLYAGYSEDLSDLDDSEIEKRNSDFVRFGRSDSDKYVYEDTRKPKKDTIRKSDNFIRFGRNGNQFLRFGRDQNKTLRDGEIYLRFGRSATKNENNPRPKRSTAPDEYPKRKDAFLRFGRNPDSGREIRIPSNSPLVYVLAELLARKGGQWQNAPYTRIVEGN